MTIVPPARRLGAPVSTVALAAGALVLATLLVPGPATAGLGPASTLAPAGSAVVVATDQAGNAAAAWVSGGQVQVSRRTPGTPAWTPAATLGPAGVTASDPDVSVGPDGTAAVAWIGDASVYVAVQPPDRGWAPAVQVSTDPMWADRDPQVEVGPAGVATLVWAGTRTSDGASTVRTTTASATSVSKPNVALYPSPVPATVFSGLSLARNGSGDTVAAWRSEGPGGQVQAARRLSGQAWSSAQPVWSGTIPDATSAAIDGAGHASVAFTAGTGEADARALVSDWARGAGSPGPAVDVSGGPARQVQVARSAGGLRAITWTSAAGLTYVDSGSPATVLAGGGIAAHALSVSDSGSSAVAYAPVGAGITVAQRLTPSSAWAGLPVTSTPGAVPSVSAHGADATLAWSEGGSGAVQARTLDNGAPTAVHMTAPMRVLNQGKRIRAGWIGADAWSPVTYEVERQVATHRTPLGAPAIWLRTTAVSGVVKAKPGQTVCQRVRGSDAAGNTGPWSVPRCATVAVDDTTLRPKRLGGKAVWRTVRKAKGSYSRTYTQATRKGATLSLPVRARRFALLVGTGRGHGSVRVSLGTTSLGTYSLASDKAASQVVIPVTVLGRARKGRLKITVTSSGKPVRIDGVYAGPS